MAVSSVLCLALMMSTQVRAQMTPEEAQTEFDRTCQMFWRGDTDTCLKRMVRFCERRQQTKSCQAFAIVKEQNDKPAVDFQTDG